MVQTLKMLTCFCRSSCIFLRLQRSLSYTLPLYRCRTSSYLKQTRCVFRSQDVQYYRTEPNNELLMLNKEITDALLLGKPVVALESTVISHGLPYPENLRTAQELEDIVRLNGAIPATIAIFDGKIHIGLTSKQLEYLSKEKNVVKVSRRDLAAVISKGLTGATTVSATMVAAHKVGITVFVTGGIGGVHRQGHSTMDISTDLTELGRTPVAVVSAGIKSILDIGRTLEYLETQGVTVATLGGSSSGHFPAFFSPSSEFQSPYNVNTPLEAAQLIDKSCQLGLQNGVLIAVPIPENQIEIGEEIERAIQRALLDAEKKGISGKEVTPYVLKRVNELTGGKSLESNLLLLKNNATVGSQIAKELSDLVLARKTRKGVSQRKSQTSFSNSVTVIGGTVVDFIARLSTPNAKLYGFTNPGNVTKSFGGVARNIADCLSRLGINSTLLTAVGDDQHADNLISSLHHMDIKVHRTPGGRTATYSAILKNNGELLIGVGDMDINNEITPQFLSQYVDDITQSKFVCMDGNIPLSSMDYIFSLCSEHCIPVWFEPTCIQKATQPFRSSSYKAITVTSPNYAELQSIDSVVESQENLKVGSSSADTSELPLDAMIEDCLKLSRPLLQHIPCVVTTLGQHGVLICQNKKSNNLPFLSSLSGPKGSDGLVSAIHYPPFPSSVQSDTHLNVSGAGDCFAGGMISGLVKGFEAKKSVLMGLYAAQQSLMSFHAVPPGLRWPNDPDLATRGWHPRIIV